MFLNLIDKIEARYINKNTVKFRAGDLLEVKIWVKEGLKKRLQSFEGIVISKRNRGINSSFTVRKNSYGEMVEKIFLIHSPIIFNIFVKKRNFISKSKLYYLRKNNTKLINI